MHFMMHSNQQGPRDSSNVPAKSVVALRHALANGLTRSLDSRGPHTVLAAPRSP